MREGILNTSAGEDVGWWGCTSPDAVEGSRPIGWREN